MARQRDYAAEYQARKARAERRGLSVTQARGHGGGVRGGVARLRTEAGLRAATPAQLEFRAAESEAIRRLRAGEASSVTDAERQLDLPRGSLRRDFPTAFDSRGRVTSGDREAMAVRVVGPNGDTLVVVRGSRQRKLAGEHRIAVYGVLDGRFPESALDRYRGKTVGGVELEADLDRLRSLFELGLIVGGPYPESPLR